MKKMIFSIVNMGKKRFGLVALCMLLIVALGTGLVACSSSNAQTLPMGTGSSSSEEQNLECAVAVGDVVQFGGFDWRVLEVKDGNALVLSDKILFRSAYNLPSDPIPWEECGLRQYLNGEFYDDTFSEEEKELIVETLLINEKNPWFPESNPDYSWYSMPGGNNTTDKVFLLSLNDIVQYFGDSGELAKGASNGISFISDQFNDARIAEMEDGKVLWWWLRSPGLFYSACGANFCYATSVTSFGGIGIEGELVDNQAGGVRPAMWLNL